MRVNVESDLWASGRLGAFARALGVGECEALGLLVFVWHETQHRELMLVTEAAFAGAVSVRLGDTDPSKVFAAMVRAQLISHVEGDTWLIRGNDEHVSRLRQLRSSASAGGQARGKQMAASRQPQGSLKAASSLAKGKHVLASPEPSPSHRPASTQPSRSAPYSLLHTDHDLDPSDPYLIQSINSEDLPPSGKTPKNGVSPSGRIRAAYLAGYEKKFGRPFGGWGAKANGQASQLIRDWPADRVIELLGLFFDWNNPRAISAGYPFGFFVSAIHEIDADTHSPERKRLARTLDAAERQVSHKDAEQLTLDAELAQIRARRAEAERKALGAPSPTGVAS